MKFIFKKQIKYYTKEAFRWLNIVAVALLLIITIIFIKYKPAYSVTISGTQVGIINNKEEFENKIEENIQNISNMAYADIKNAPKYKLTLVSKQKETDEEQVLKKIQDETEITYEYYAVTIDKKQKSVVKTLEEAEKVVASLKKEHESASKNVNIEIQKLLTKEKDKYEISTVKVAKKEATKILEKIEDASVNGIYLAQKPITGVITSRFGSRESIRSHAHTGLDIAAPTGTKIKSATKGTVIWSGELGTYGNLIIVDGGNGVNIYYGHCSKLIAKKGEKVKAGDVIGLVGSTGNSTGPHLHFEIRVNGIRVNPQNYIYK